MKLKEKIYGITIETSNGFPYVYCLAADSYEEAHKYVNKHESEFMPATCGWDTFKSIVKSETELMDDIKHAIDISDDYTDFHYDGEFDSYTISIPKKDIFWNECLCEDDAENEYFVKFVERRPCDPENKDDKEYIYDVHMIRFTGGWEPDSEGIEYVESLECVSEDVFAFIYCSICEEM